MGSSSPHEKVLQHEGILVPFFFPQLAAMASAPWPAPHRFSYVLRQAIHCFCEWKGASGRLLALWYNELPSCPCWMPAIAQAGRLLNPHLTEKIPVSKVGRKWNAIGLDLVAVEAGWWVDGGGLSWNGCVCFCIYLKILLTKGKSETTK